jgi:hypothetical protein
MKKFLMAAAAAAFAATPAAAQQRVEIGMLDCVVEGGAGFVVGSTKDLRCTFMPAGNRPAEPYFGVVRKFGLDIGVTGTTIIKWAVLATAGAYAPGALAGDYVGVSAEATVGVGLGANALVGGSAKSFALQPLSVQAQEGLNLAVGFSSFELRSAI